VSKVGQVDGRSRVQLCGRFVVQLDGRRIDPELPGRQGRLLFAYLVLNRPESVSRDALVDALWGDQPPSSAPAALSVLVSRVRAAVGPEVVRGRSELWLVLPEPAHVDIEVAIAALHAAESRLALRDWRGAWSPALTALFVGRRRFLDDAETPWFESWRRRLGDVRLRGLECYAESCLHLGGTELPGAEQAARELVEIAPLHETGHVLLMRALAARGNVAQALATYDQLRVLLRKELGVSPGQAAQALHAELIR
jgi:DNA-binding SARP family transcriptional activator